MFQCSSASRKFLNQRRAGGRRTDADGRFSALQRAENSSIGKTSARRINDLGFSALQRAENSSILAAVFADAGDAPFQCSSASRKFLNARYVLDLESHRDVSVLFSEPKIPQCRRRAGVRQRDDRRFSALQRAENSSIHRTSSNEPYRRKRFSALQRAENSSIQARGGLGKRRPRFSALQRAENSSITQSGAELELGCRFSALQRAENSSMRLRRLTQYVYVSFSALQRAENSSITRDKLPELIAKLFQCSSASRKFLNRAAAEEAGGERRFSALQRAENSSIRHHRDIRICVACFSALQRAENSSMYRRRKTASVWRSVSVLFSEPKIPQSAYDLTRAALATQFQCSSASRKFLNSGKLAAMFA